MDVYHYDTVGPVFSSTYSILCGDTWCMPRYIGRGCSGPENGCHQNTVLVPRPDCGVWAVHDSISSSSESPAVCVDAIAGDSLRRITTFEGRHPRAAADSSGRLWVVFIRDGALRSVELEGSVIVDELRIDDDPLYHSAASSVCTDPMGWAWAAWTRGDSTPVVSYDRGGGWAAPEAVTESCAMATSIRAENDGRMHVFFVAAKSGRHYSTYRLDRPAVTEGPALADRAAWPQVTFIRGVLFLVVGHDPIPPVESELCPRPVLLDISGRRMMDLVPGANDVSGIAPGVYFMLSATTDRQARTAKVVITE